METVRPPFRNWWTIRDGVRELNHGSFGPSPRVVQEERALWSARLESEPMDFFLREMEPALDVARAALGGFVGSAAENLVFVDNATFGMNIVAASFPLAAGDEVLLNNHEYGAVLRIWRHRAEQVGATVRVARLPDELRTPNDIGDALCDAIGPRTKLLVVSHITSPTAVTFPMPRIVQRARERGVSVCVDGPHALAILPLTLDKLGCDFYTASCHKWLAAPFGSGFLYVHPRWQSRMRPHVVSWGDSLGDQPKRWNHEFTWLGTRDPAPFLSVPKAIEFLQHVSWSDADEPVLAPYVRPELAAAPDGLGAFRVRCHALARYARQRIEAVTGLPALVPDDPAWYGPMLALPLPASVGEPRLKHRHELQDRLWNEHRIEVPIVNWNGRRFVRVSCHLYNTVEEIDTLAAALKEVCS